MVDNAQRSDSPQWGDLAAGPWHTRALPPGPAAAVCHISVDDHMTQAGQYDPDAPQTKPAPPPGFGRRAYLDDLSTPPTGGSLPPQSAKSATGCADNFRLRRGASRPWVRFSLRS